MPACWRLAPYAVSLDAGAGKFSRSLHFVLKLKQTHRCVLHIIATISWIVKHKVKNVYKNNLCVIEREKSVLNVTEGDILKKKNSDVDYKKFSDINRGIKRYVSNIKNRLKLTTLAKYRY